MTKREFDACFRLANDRTRDLSNIDDQVLHGCALPGFRRVTAEPEAVARFIRWHCQNLDGTWDSEALDEMQNVFRRTVDVVGAS